MKMLLVGHSYHIASYHISLIRHCGYYLFAVCFSMVTIEGWLVLRVAFISLGSSQLCSYYVQGW